jgi:NADH-quinone oxidoreductase subunit E
LCVVLFCYNSDETMEASIDHILKKFVMGGKADLIPLLQEIQEEIGFLSEEAIVRVGKQLGLSTTKIYGLATFYDQFRFLPLGKIHLKICNGTSCFMNGSSSLIKIIKDEIGIEPGQNSRDGIFSYEIVSCMGGCSSGPVIKVNNEYHTGVRPEQIPDLIVKLKFIIDNN